MENLNQSSRFSSRKGFLATMGLAMAGIFTLGWKSRSSSESNATSASVPEKDLPFRLETEQRSVPREDRV